MLTADTGAHIRSRLDALLKGRPSPEFAIAFSGGGDSTALLHALRGHSHCKAVLIIDHALRKESGVETKTALKFAKSLGYDASLLTWVHDDPSTGLQEKARKARYRLIGNACRARNILNIVTAHTFDDQAETLLMRYDKGTDWRGAAGMSDARFAPLWPELAGMTVLRPALGIGRADLRTYNRTNNLNWIEDPSNQNTDFSRIEARQYLRSRGDVAANLVRAAKDLGAAREDEKRLLLSVARKNLRLDHEGLIYVSGDIPLRLWEFVLQAVSGRGTPISWVQRQTLSKDLKSAKFKGATLAGVKITPFEDGIFLSRDLGAVAGRAGQLGLAKTDMMPGKTLWDGRYWIETTTPGLRVEPFGQRRIRLTKTDDDALARVPHFVRQTLPVVTGGQSIMSVGEAISHPDVSVVAAVREHLEGRLGGVLPK